MVEETAARVDRRTGRRVCFWFYRTLRGVGADRDRG